MNTKRPTTEQEEFWTLQYADEYVKKNRSFDQQLGTEGWAIMLRKAQRIGSYLECGCNIGRNLSFLARLLPDAKPSLVEISEPAYRFATTTFPVEHSFNGSIVDSDFQHASFDLVFTIGVLIHIDPADLLANMRKMFDYSNRYILMGEYFNRTPVMLEYQGQQNKLFKRDFGKLFIESFPVRLVDYGFLWGHIYDTAGFDDITWWLFEKR